MKSQDTLPSPAPLAGLDVKGLRVTVLIAQGKRCEKDFLDNFTPLSRQMKLVKILLWGKAIKDTMIQTETYNISDTRKEAEILKLNLLVKIHVTYVCLETYISNHICFV